MSASLVGSEMCIRDRYSEEASHSSGESEPSPVCAPRTDRSRANAARASTCLLYTSDAADDM
eukprot:15065813-Alexandrium_andersonii.AAC.1